MITIAGDQCKGCGLCVKNCPLEGIEIIDNKARTNGNCVSCGICARICPFSAVRKTQGQDGCVVCTHCPVGCSIPVGKTGACKRYAHQNGKLVRTRALVMEAAAKTTEKTALPHQPLVTAVGSGTNYPCCRPAPVIVQDRFNGVDVVTVVTEAPLSYSGVKVKIDTNVYIGDESSKVRRDGKIVGMVTTEEYGAKMLTIGGANLLSHGNNGFIVARTIVDLANGREVTLKVDGGSTLQITQGKPPVINGAAQTRMRVGCGSATIGMFAKPLSEVVDEAIILDYHVIGLLSEHLAGEEVGMRYSGVVPKGTKSTRGRYFGTPGHGWGGTDICDPQEAVAYVDMAIAKIGSRILVTETTGEKAALLMVTKDGGVVQTPMTDDVRRAVALIADTCEQSSVSVIYTGGTGGSARAGVTTMPKKLTEAVHDETVRLTIGGAEAYVLPGGGINFMVDVSKMVPDAITWVPTPATVAPVEYTMTRDTYERLGGHMHCITDKDAVTRGDL